MVEAVFFYGTLMTGFERRRRAGVEPRLAYVGHGSIQGSLFDLGLYPAAVPSNEGRIRGEVYRMSRPESVLPILDEVEGYSPDDSGRSLYTREAVAVTLDQGGTHQAWAYFYNAPLGKATRILSGDYLAHVHRTQRRVSLGAEASTKLAERSRGLRYTRPPWDASGGDLNASRSWAGWKAR